jgi:hypothetical protein
LRSRKKEIQTFVPGGTYAVRVKRNERSEFSLCQEFPPDFPHEGEIDCFERKQSPVQRIDEDHLSGRR